MTEPAPMPGFLQFQPDGVLLRVKLQPRASVNAIGEPLGDELRVKVTAPPVDAAANEALLRLLAETSAAPAAGWNSSAATLRATKSSNSTASPGPRARQTLPALNL
jgi:hypothetical protein